MFMSKEAGECAVAYEVRYAQLFKALSKMLIYHMQQLSPPFLQRDQGIYCRLLWVLFCRGFL